MRPRIDRRTFVQIGALFWGGAAGVAGVALGLGNSLSPTGNAKFVDLVGHPTVGVY